MKELWFENIDRYLNNEMSVEEREAFNKEMAESDELASIFSVYKTAETEMRLTESDRLHEQELKQSLQTLGSRYFLAEEKSIADRPQAAVRKINSTNWIRYAAAACLLLLVAGYYFFNQKTPAQLAEKYKKDNLEQLSQTMDGSRDSLQLGIAAYNNKDYTRAIIFFEGVKDAHHDNIDAKKYTGLTYLMMKDYTHALNTFSELAVIKGLYSNPGMFYQAVTLLERNAESDKPNAKQLLERVVREKQEGYHDAQEWLKKWKD